MTKLLNELEAWKICKGAWEDPLIANETGECLVKLPNGQKAGYGLCNCINRLSLINMINHKTAYAMNKRMLEHMPAHVKREGWYWWDLDRDGAKQRVEFCQKMIDAIKSESTDLGGIGNDE
jgi:hypothetical protein